VVPRISRAASQCGFGQRRPGTAASAAGRHPHLVQLQVALLLVLELLLHLEQLLLHLIVPLLGGLRSAAPELSRPAQQGNGKCRWHRWLGAGPS
jgi:hypothetical protein